jgi:AraC-like DNA-binding protein/mannose-6-phosphate isomerase-like protein (cupin superfamily)
MRSPGEVFVTAPDSMAGRFPVQQASVATALAQAGCRFVSCLQWRTAADWSIRPRRLDDLFLFLPISGRLVVHGPAGTEALAPGTCAIVPHGVEHAVHYASAPPTCTVLAIHAHLTTAWGAPWFGRPQRLVAMLPEHLRWIDELRRLSGIAHDEPELAASLGRLLVRRLLIEAVLAGHPVSPPASNIDPRLAAIVARIQADPGATPSLATMARELGLGPLRLRQLFHASLGCAPKAYIDRLRLGRAADMLRAGHSVGATARACGFASLRALQLRFKRVYGSTPSAWASGTPDSNDI